MKIVRKGLSLLLPNLLLATPFASADIMQDIDQLKKKGELVVAIHSEDHPPFHMHSKEGKFTGLDVEIAEEIARLLKIKVRFDRSAKTYDEVIEVVAAGKADLAISKLSHTPRRAFKVLFSEPYHTLSKSCLINRVQLAAAGEVSLEELVSPPKKDQASQNHPLSPKTAPVVGTLKGSSYERYVKVTFPHTEIQTLPTWKELTDKAADGKITAVCTDNNEIKVLVSKNPNVALKLMPVQLKEPDYLYIGCSKDLPSLQSWIDVMIKNNPNLSLTYERLAEKYKKELQ